MLLNTVVSSVVLFLLFTAPAVKARENVTVSVGIRSLNGGRKKEQGDNGGKVESSGKKGGGTAEGGNECRSGFAKQEGRCLCVSTCPSNSKLKQNDTCPTNIDRDCSCLAGFKLKGPNCVKTNRFRPSLPAFGQSLALPYDSCKYLERDIVQSLQFVANGIIDEEVKLNPNGCPRGRNGQCQLLNREAPSVSGGNTGDRKRHLSHSYEWDNVDTISSRNLRRKRNKTFNTNNQVNGVEEGDKVKSDGKYIFLPYFEFLFMVTIDGKVVDRVNIGGGDLLLLDPKAKVVTVVDRILSSATEIKIFSYDNEKLTRRTSFYIAGKCRSVRSIENKIHVATSDDLGEFAVETLKKRLRICRPSTRDLTLDEYEMATFNKAKQVTKTLARRVVRSLRRQPFSNLLTDNDVCQKILRVSTMSNKDLRTLAPTLDQTTLFTRKLVRISSFDMSQLGIGSNSSDVQVTGFFSPRLEPNVFYLTKQLLFVAEANPRPVAESEETWESHTSLIAFKFQDINRNLTPIATKDLPGHVFDRYSFDFQNAVLRLGTEAQRLVVNNRGAFVEVNYTRASCVNLVRMSNHKGMQLVGQSKSPAQTGLFRAANSIFSFHFAGTRGYVLQRRNRSFTVVELFPFDSPQDLSNMKVNATFILNSVTNENNELLLGAGKSSGSFTLYLIDVTDPSKPKEIHDTPVSRFRSRYFPDYRRTVSYDSKTQKLVIPVEDFTESALSEVNGFFLFDVDKTKGITLVKEVPHEYFSFCSTDKRIDARALFFSEYLVTLKGTTMKGTNLGGSSLNDWELDFHALLGLKK